MLDLRKQDVVAEKVDGSSFEKSFTGRESYEVLKRAMNSVCLVYYVQFQKLLEAMEQFGEDIIRGMQSVVFETLYNTPWIVELLDS